MAKFKTLSLSESISMASIFFVQMFNVSTLYNVYTKYQDVSVKAVEQVEFPVYTLTMHH